MDTSILEFADAILRGAVCKSPTQKQIQVLAATARRADFERLTRGDFVIPLNSPRLNEVVNPTTPLGDLLLIPTEENVRALWKVLLHCKMPILNIEVSANLLRVHLKRTEVIKASLPRITKEGMNYGANKILHEVCITVNHSAAQGTENTLRYTRGAKLTSHLCNILEFCGAKVNTKESLSGRKLVAKSKLDEDSKSTKFRSTEMVHITEESICEGQSLPPGSFVKDEENRERRQLENRQDSEVSQKRQHTEPDSDEGSSRALNVSEGKTKVICEPKESNTGTKTQTQSSRVSKEMESAKEDENLQNKSPSLSTQGKDEHRDEEVELVVTDSMEGVRSGSWAYHYGGVVDVKTGRSWIGSAQEYSSIIIDELKRTSEMRQREAGGVECSVILEQQAERCLVLQLLRSPHANPLRVELEGQTHNTKEVSFMLYNFARLQSILDHFAQCVQQGETPPLPPPEEVDFSLLRTDEEWDLLWLYLLKWPEIVRDMALAVKDRKNKLKTSQVSRFLYALTHRWSEYYSKHQVLSEGFLPHLLPLMHSRLHLLHALSTLMRVCFAILGVHTLPSYM